METSKSLLLACYNKQTLGPLGEGRDNRLTQDWFEHIYRVWPLPQLGEGPSSPCTRSSSAERTANTPIGKHEGMQRIKLVFVFLLLERRFWRYTSGSLCVCLCFRWPSWRGVTVLPHFEGDEDDTSIRLRVSLRMTSNTSTSACKTGLVQSPGVDLLLVSRPSPSAMWCGCAAGDMDTPKVRSSKQDATFRRLSDSLPSK